MGLNLLTGLRLAYPATIIGCINVIDFVSNVSNNSSVSRWVTCSSRITGRCTTLFCCSVECSTDSGISSKIASYDRISFDTYSATEGITKSTEVRDASASTSWITGIFCSGTIRSRKINRSSSIGTFRC